MRLSRLATPSLVALAAACGKAPAKDAAVAPTDSLANVDFKMITATVKNVDKPKPTCPVIPHFEATLTVSHLSGELTYRWERSTGKNSDTKTITIPGGAAKGTVDLVIDPDEWLQTDRGVQLNPSDKVHVLSPIDRVSQPMAAPAICF